MTNTATTQRFESTCTRTHWSDEDAAYCGACAADRKRFAENHDFHNFNGWVGGCEPCIERRDAARNK